MPFLIDPTANLNFTRPVFKPYQNSFSPSAGQESKEHPRDAFDEEEVFDIVRTINDPEHPLTLEQLNVVNLEDIQVFDALAFDDPEKSEVSTVEIMFT